MANDENFFVCVTFGKFVDRRYDAVREFGVRLGAGCSKAIRILEVALGGAWKLLVELCETQPVPSAAVDLFEPRVDNNVLIMMLRNESRANQGTPQWARVDGSERVATQIFGNRFESCDTFGSKIDVVVAVDTAAPLRLYFAVPTKMDSSRASRRGRSQEPFLSFSSSTFGS